MKRSRLALAVVIPLFVPAAIAAGCGSSSGVGFADSGAGNDSDSGGFGGDTGSASDTGSLSDAGSIHDSGADAHPWPDCSTQPADAPTRSISDIWSADAGAPALAWVNGVTISAISYGACSAGHTCQIFLQTDATYATLADGAHKAIKMFVSSAAATHFSSAKVGDTVNAMGWGWRYNLDGQNEILLEVNDEFQGCVKKTGTLALTPIAGVSLGDLTVDNYENTYGPLLVEVDNTRGTTTSNLTETFGLVPGADGGFFDAGPEIVSLSPFFLVNGTFAAPMTTNTLTHFASIVGVFGLFVPVPDGGAPVNYDELYPRTMGDLTTF